MKFWKPSSQDYWRSLIAFFVYAVGFSCSQTPSDQSGQSRSTYVQRQPIADHKDCDVESCADVGSPQAVSSEPGTDNAENTSATPHSESTSTAIQTSTSKAVRSPPSTMISPPASNSTEAQILSGERIYRANCGTGGPCHAAAKNGPGNIINNRSDQALNIAINSVPSRGGRVIKLTPEEIRDLGVYLRAP
jgi:hypothetical protein